jgi:NADPH:quinone reductase-like Zn-dependent oxidoreductase
LTPLAAGEGELKPAAASSSHTAPSPPNPYHSRYSRYPQALTIKGYTLFELVSDPVAFPKAKQDVYGHLASGDFKPRVDKTFPFDKIVEAHRYMESNAQIGKIVVTV